MKTFFLIPIVLCWTTFSFGQYDQLEPANDFTNQNGILSDYYSQLLPKLLNGFSKSPIARYVVIPSFSPEYAFSVEEDSSLFILKTASCYTSYWYAKNRDSVKIVSTKIPIDKELGTLLKELFIVVTKNIRKPEPLTGGLDGTTYYFSTQVNKEDFITGKKWSPKKGSKMFELVNLCENLMYYSNQQNGLIKYPKQKIDTQTLVIQLKKLLERLAN